jgi:hypothetical protein
MRASTGWTCRARRRLHIADAREVRQHAPALAALLTAVVVGLAWRGEP